MGAKRPPVSVASEASEANNASTTPLSFLDWKLSDDCVFDYQKDSNFSSFNANYKFHTGETLYKDGSLAFSILYLLISSGAIQQSQSTDNTVSTGSISAGSYLYELENSTIDKISNSPKSYNNFINSLVKEDVALTKTVEYKTEVKLKSLPNDICNYLNAGNYCIIKTDDSWKLITGYSSNNGETIINYASPYSGAGILEVKDVSTLAVYKVNSSLKSLLEFYKLSSDSKDEKTLPWELTLINASNKLTDSQIQDVKLTSCQSVQVNEKILESLNRMIADANKDGVTLTIAKGFESPADSDKEYSRMESEIKDDVKQAYLKGFCNEHNLGIAVDFAEVAKAPIEIVQSDKPYTVDGIMIVNKSYPLPQDYRDDVTATGVSAITTETQTAYREFLEALKASGMKSPTGKYELSSGFRSYSLQQTLYNNYCKKDGQALADKYSARAGYSEHQTGLAFDFLTADDKYNDNATMKWLDNNCWKYGLILRYPKGKESITGYQFESWHFRYVGKDLAKELYNNGDWKTLEEKFNLKSDYSNNCNQTRVCKSSEYDWLLKNSYKYGFILRYPQNSISTTGIRYIPYHWRYIGFDYAKEFVQFSGGTINSDGQVDNAYTQKSFEEFIASKKKILSSSQTDGTKEVDKDNTYSDAPIRILNYFLLHPIKCIENLLVCSFQYLHLTISDFTSSSLLDCTSLFKTLLMQKVTTIYYGVMFVCLAFACILRFIYFMIDKSDLFTSALSDVLKQFGLILLPVVSIGLVFYSLSWSSNLLTSSVLGNIVPSDVLLSDYKPVSLPSSQVVNMQTPVTSDDSSSLDSLASLEEIANSDSQKVNNYGVILTSDILQDTIFKEQFEDSYVPLECNIGGTLIKLSDLYKEVSVSNKANNLSEDNYLMYRPDRFVPVNYASYSKSVFYYFYDYLMYQYLGYFAQGSTYKSSMTLAQEYALSGVKDTITEDELFDDYKNRIVELSKTFPTDSVNNAYLMYSDTSYSFGRDDYVNDILGLSNLFNMTSDDTLKNASTSLSSWVLTKSNLYTKQTVSFSEYRKGNTSLIDRFPCVKLFSSTNWNLYYSQSRYIHRTSSFDMQGFYFTPLYLSSDKFSNRSIIHKVYATIGNSTYQYTPLEVRLQRINTNTFNKYISVLQKYKGTVSDELLIFDCALLATREFDNTFAPSKDINIQSSNITIDKIFRDIYCYDINQSVTNPSLLYAVHQQTGGLIHCLCIALDDLALLIVSLSRTLLFCLLAIGIVINCIKAMFNLQSDLKTALLGLSAQVFTLITAQFLMFGMFELSSLVLSSQCLTAFRILVSILLTIGLSLVAIYSFSAMLSTLKDMSHYGGATIKSKINSFRESIKAKESKLNNNSNNAEISEFSGILPTEVSNDAVNSLEELLREKKRDKIEEQISNDNERS